MVTNSNEERTFIVSRGKLNDLAEVHQLFVDTISVICSADYSRQQIEVWTSSVENTQRWHDIMTNQFVFVARCKDKIVGFATLSNGNFIDLFYVHKDYQRQGIAKKLFAEIETEARRLVQKNLTSDVSKSAKLFFERIGFKVLTEQTVNREGVDFVNYKMEKALDYMNT